MMCLRIPQSVARIFLLSLVFISPANADSDTEHRVTNLAYGESLFHFFQDKYFSAITDLSVAKHYNRLTTEDKNPELLLGGMYLSYGLPGKSSEIFSELLDESSEETSQSVRDRALYHLGKSYYQSSRFEESLAALEKVDDTLDDEHEAERLYMLGNIYINNNELEKADIVLDDFDDNIWRDYIIYNLGTGLIRENQNEEGMDLLDELNNAGANSYEKKLLKDKANIALAYTALRQNDTENANTYFNQVRLDSSQTSSGLLGLGWAWYQKGVYDKALVAWMELAAQIESSPAKHEALVTIPYAFEKTANPEQALFHYNFAIDSYTNDLREINQVITRIKSGQFIRALQPGTLGTESSVPSSVLKLLDPITNKYLSSLFTSYDFNNALKKYQELSYLIYILNHWETNIPALRVILNEKRNTYNDKLKQGIHKPKTNKARELYKRRKQVEKTINRLATQDDTLELATVEEQQKLNLLDKTKTRLDKLKGSEDLTEQQDKYRLMSGLMQWSITTDYAPRMWDTRLKLYELNYVTNKMSRRLKSLSKTWKTSPGRFSNFYKQIVEKERRIVEIKQQMANAAKQQEQLISSLALTSATEYANRLRMYHDRALFAKARIFDTLTAPKDIPVEKEAPTEDSQKNKEAQK